MKTKPKSKTVKKSTARPSTAGKAKSVRRPAKAAAPKKAATRKAKPATATKKARPAAAASRTKYQQSGAPWWKAFL